MRFSSGYKFKCTALLLIVISFLMTIQALAQSTDFNRYYENGKKKKFYVSANWAYAMLETNIRFETSSGFLSFKNLKHRGIRSWLTLLGIFIGVMAVVALIGLGNGFSEIISVPNSTFSPSIVTIRIAETLKQHVVPFVEVKA